MIVSKNFPFGNDDVDTLIVCRNEIHRIKIFKAFQIKAMYVDYGAMLAGRAFKRIIVFMPDRTLPLHEYNMFRDWLDKVVEIKILPEGEIHYVY